MGVNPTSWYFSEKEKWNRVPHFILSVTQLTKHLHQRTCFQKHRAIEMPPLSMQVSRTGM